METFFFISLGITFVLILLLVYHFKQRLATAEQKADTMFEIVNNIAQEMSGIKNTVVSLMTRPSIPFIHQQQSTIPLDQRFSEIIRANIQDEFEHALNADEDDDSDDSDSDLDDDDDDDDDEKIIVSDDEADADFSVQEIPIEIIDDCNVENASKCEAPLLIPNESATEIIELNSTENREYSKMSLSALKALVVEKGILEDPSKMKKTKLIELIEQHAA